MASRRDFLSQPAPENYVAGIGRGAVGFTTRSDLGPARDGPSEEQISSAIKKRSEQLGLTEAKDGGENDAGGDDGRYQDPDNEVGLFAGGIYEKDDEEADRIWKEVDEKMAKRRQKQRLVHHLPSLQSPPPSNKSVYRFSMIDEDEQNTDTSHTYTGKPASKTRTQNTSARTQKSSSSSPT